ncbi:FAD binding domain-containing protein [Falsiroseomonas sp. E2-1-a20]|uniref:FAD binding domain-containing protein n=1 Tax=Falsiroseomonas sp. E2-1-a20 TaxID=3239300 RepID=UPI003F349842
MTHLGFERAADAADASHRLGTGPGAQILAGGTGTVDLMRLGVTAPERLVEILDLRAEHAAILFGRAGASIGALATMAEVAAHPAIRARWTAVAEALNQSASPQIRNAATIGGNLLQRTRCAYFRDAASPCNKRRPGTGCSALEGGLTWDLAILGTSPHCIANYPGDLAVALSALDASITVVGADGNWRSVAVEDLHREPGERPDLDTVLGAGDLILAAHLPELHWSRSSYLKVRDRESYAFALVSVAVALRLEEGRIVDLRIVLGGLATKPLRCRAAEEAVRGRSLDLHLAAQAAALCLEGAQVDAERAFKAEQGRRAIARALLAAGGHEKAACRVVFRGGF